jgi:hypothetical protein
VEDRVARKGKDEDRGNRRQQPALKPHPLNKDLSAAGLIVSIGWIGHGAPGGALQTVISPTIYILQQLNKVNLM